MAMVKKEDGQSGAPIEGGRTSGEGATSSVRKPEKPNINALQEFLLQIKLFALLKKNNPGTVGYEKLKEIEVKLSSKDNKERVEAKESIDLLAVEYEVANDKASKESLSEVVKQVFDPGITRPAEVNLLVETITSQNIAISSKLTERQKITEDELFSFEKNLFELKDLLGMREESKDGLKKMQDTLVRAIELRKVRKFEQAPSAYVNPIEPKKNFFSEGSNIGDNPEKIIVRQAPHRQRAWLENKVETTKKHIREELLQNNGEGVAKLEGKDLLSRLEDITDLKARAKNLVGRETGRMSDTLSALSAAEMQYRSALEEKVANDLKMMGEKIDRLAVDEAVSEILSEAKGGRRATGRERYVFGDDAYPKIVDQVAERAKILVESGYAPEQTLHEFFEQMQPDAAGLEGAMNVGKKREQSVKAKAATIGDLLDRAKVDARQVLSDLEKIKDKKERLDYVKAVEKKALPLLGESEKRVFIKFLDGAAGDERFLDVQRRLEDHVHNGRLGQYMVELKAYIARIGLKETSADFQFAFILRNAKDVISSFESDIADEWDAWQGSLFVPPAKAVSPEAYRQIFEKVWGAGNLDHVFNTTYANAEAISITINGERKNMSTAVFYQLLQSSEDSVKLLNAPVNSSDSTAHGITAQYLFGRGVTVVGSIEDGVDRRKIMSENGLVLFDAQKDKISVQYFDLVSKKLQEGTERELSLAEFQDQVTWMERYATNFWMYSGEAGKHYRHYPKEDMENANKWVMAQDQLFEGYGGHFGKYSGPFWQIAKLGHLLREIRAYKDSGVVKGAMLEALKSGGMADSKAAKFADLLGNKMIRKIKVEGKTFKGDLLALEEARLIGNEYANPVEAWNAGKWWLVAHGIPENMVKNATEIKSILDRKALGQKLSEQDENWAAQAGEFFELCKSLQWSSEERAFFGSITAADLAPLVAKQNEIFGSNWAPQNMNEFMKNFQFAAALNLAKYAQGTDTVEYAQKYMKLAEEVAKMLPKIEMGAARAKDFIELRKTLSGYLTPEEVDDYIEILTRKTIQTHRSQTFAPYEIAKTKDDNRTIDYRTQKAADGHTYYFIDRDGHRIAKTEMYNGNFFKERFNHKGWRDSDVETLMAAMSGESMIPRKIAESILDDLIGGGRTIDRVLGAIGIDTKDKKSVGRVVKMVLARGFRFIKRLPLFDDPAWAMWSFGAELLNFTIEAGKEVVKAGTK